MAWQQFWCDRGTKKVNVPLNKPTFVEMQVGRPADYVGHLTEHGLRHPCQSPLGYLRDQMRECSLNSICHLFWNWPLCSSLFEQKLAYYSKMQEAQECNASPSNSSGSSSFSSQTPASIKEEEGSPEKERPPEAEYINSRCVLFTYFQGDISSVVDEHFSRALSQPSSYSPSCTSNKAPRSSGPWRGEYETSLAKGIEGPLNLVST